MDNLFMILSYCPFLVITVILLISVLFRKNKIRFDYLYIALSADLVLWLVAEMSLYIVSDHSAIEYLMAMKFAFVGFVPALFLFVVLDFYNLWKPATKWVRWLIVAIPIMVAVFAFGEPLFDILVSSIVIDTTVEPTYIKATYTIWYYIALTLGQITAAAIAGIILSKRRKLPPEYRTAINLLIGVVLLYLVGIAVQFSGFFGDLRIQTGLMAICIANLLFYIAVSSNGRADFLNVWRRDVFDYLDEAILIIDNRGQVVSANLAAQKVFNGVGINLKDVMISELDEQIHESNVIYSRDSNGEGSDAVARDLYITDGRYPIIYEVLIKPVPEFLGVGPGEYQILTEVTRNRLFIERLRDIAGVDTLTGLKNRFGYEQTLREWDVQESLPLSIIIGDVNGLKRLNDNYGHKEGDRFLKSVADVLNQCAPSDGFAARIGGDEFLIVVKNYSDAQAKKLISTIHQRVDQITDLPEPVSIALGSATKETIAENINALYAQADAYMYAEKYDFDRMVEVDAGKGNC